MSKTKKKMVTNEQKENKLIAKKDPFAEEVQATIDRLIAGERILDDFIYEKPLPVVPEIVEPVFVPEPVEVIPEPVEEILDP